MCNSTSPTRPFCTSIYIYLIASLSTALRTSYKVCMYIHMSLFRSYAPSSLKPSSIHVRPLPLLFLLLLLLFGASLILKQAPSPQPPPSLSLCLLYPTIRLQILLRPCLPIISIKANAKADTICTYHATPANKLTYIHTCTLPLRRLLLLHRHRVRSPLATTPICRGLTHGQREGIGITKSKSVSWSGMLAQFAWRVPERLRSWSAINLPG